MDTQIDVSIVIVNWNTSNLLRNCLVSIYKNTANVGFEVIVVDNASDDGSAAMVEAEFAQVILIKNAVNGGYAAGCNLGIRKARGRYVLLLNSDIVICDDAIAKTVKYADGRPDAAIVTCQVWQSEETVQMTCLMFPSVQNLLLSMFGLSKAFKYNKYLGREWMLWWHRDSERAVDVASGMFLLVRRAAIDSVGMMDESFFMYYEETDWCRRFTDAGWKIMFWPGARVIHLHGGGQSTKSNSIEMAASWRKSMLLYFRKHHGWFSCLAVRCILTLSFGIRLLAWGTVILLGYVTGKSTVEAKRKSLNCIAVMKSCFVD